MCDAHLACRAILAQKYITVNRLALFIPLTPLVGSLRSPRWGQSPHAVAKPPQKDAPLGERLPIRDRLPTGESLATGDRLPTGERPHMGIESTQGKTTHKGKTVPVSRPRTGERPRMGKEKDAPLAKGGLSHEGKTAYGGK